MLEGRRGGAAAQVCVRAEAVAPARPREGRGARGGGRGAGGRGQGRAGTEGESGRGHAALEAMSALSC